MDSKEATDKLLYLKNFFKNFSKVLDSMDNAIAAKTRNEHDNKLNEKI